MTCFSQRVEQLPFLGIGISTEYGAARTELALKPQELLQAAPAFAAFLEIGVETARALMKMLSAGWP